MTTSEEPGSGGSDLKNAESYDGKAVKSILEKLLNSCVGERYVGAIEVHHVLEGLKLFEINRQFTYFNLRDTPCICG